MRDMKRYLEERIERITETGCWIWMLNTVPPYGYGQFGIGGRKVYAHRISWQIYRGPIPPGLHVCHRCDVHCCCNPDHLFTGTGKENTADMLAKGRHAHGETYPTAKLTTADACAIFVSNLPYPVLSAQYGVSKSLICRIRSGKSWPHIKKMMT